VDIKTNHKLALDNNEIHLWVTRPQHIDAPSLLNQYASLITKEENLRLERFIFDKDKHSGLVTRAFVRDLLSHYADIPPGSWIFEKGEKGRPEINNPPTPLRFNLSHTSNMIICALTSRDDIGCDVEYTSRQTNVLSVANRYFSTEETRELFRLPLEQQKSRFFDLWTLKESYIKACGLGLAIPLDDFSFTIGLQKNDCFNTDIQLSFSENRIDQPRLWQSWLFYPDTEHRVAISVKRPSHQHNSTRPYKLRFFESIPLIRSEETSWFK